MPLATVTSLGAKSIDNGVTDASIPCLLCITETMSGSGNTGAGNKISDEEETLG